MKAVTELMGKMAGKDGYMSEVAEIGATNMVGGLVPCHAKLMDIFANDPVMISLQKQGRERYKEIKIEHPELAKELDAEPWY